MFGEYLERPEDAADCIVLVLSTRPLGPAARDALEKSFAALGFGNGACTYATAFPADPDVEGADVALDAQALFMLVEGLDPIRLVMADRQAASALGAAYRTEFPTDAAARAFGRPAASFGNLDNLLTTERGKQKAWSLFKTLA